MKSERISPFWVNGYQPFSAVCLLLFILGLSIGTNKLIISNLSYFCRQAAVISALSLLGSSMAALLVSHLFFKKGVSNEK